MKIIIITSPGFLKGEAQLLINLLERGADRIHLRKPESKEGELIQLIEKIPAALHPRLSIHEHFSLIHKYALGGIHLNRRNPLPPQGYNGILSCSCHSTQEVKLHKDKMNYLFLSPIFDSISKTGYKSAFNEEELDWAMRAGIIDKKVVALGGITAKHIKKLLQWHFGGFAMLGEIWQEYHDISDAPELYKRFEQAKMQIQSLTTSTII